MKRSIEFTTVGTNTEIKYELEKFAFLVASLNMAGVPFSIRRNAIAIEITIGDGF